MSIHQEDAHIPDFGRKWVKVIANTDELLTALAAAESVANQCIVSFEKDKMVVEAANASKTAMVRAEVNSIEWDAGPEEFKLGADTTGLLNAASFYGSNGETTDLRVDTSPSPESEPYTLSSGAHLEYYNFSDPESIRSVPDLPDLDRETTTTVEASSFKGAVGSVARGSNSKYRVTLASDSVVVEGGHTWEELEESPLVAVDEQEGPKAVSEFGNSTIRGAVDAIPASEDVELVLKDDFPLTIKTERLEFTLAPYVYRGGDSE